MRPDHKKAHFHQLRVLVSIVGLLMTAGVCRGQGQPLNVVIEVVTVSPARLSIEIESTPSSRWSFRNVYGDIINLADRIENFKAIGSQGEELSVRKLAPGEFQSSRNVSKVTYEVRANEPAALSQMSHVSWLDKERGFLMLADLLPLTGKNPAGSQAAIIQFKLPESWTVASNFKPDEKLRYVLPRTNDAVFYVGRSLSEESVRVGSMELVLITSGDWAFADRDALKVASRVVKHYAKGTNYPLAGRFAIMLCSFPGAADATQWSAETRGKNAVLLIGKNASRQALLGRLSILFTHELFHFWVPNALRLEGSYDWFFEGFTLYQALLAALRLNFISFDEYLNTIARVYDSYKSLPDRDALPLIEASERRWTRSASYIYDKGFLVALIYDLSLRQASRSKRSLTDIYREIFHRLPTSPQTANEVIIRALNSPEGMSEFGHQYVLSAQELPLDSLLELHGLKVERINSRTRILVENELSAVQRQILKSIGYKQ